MLVVMISAIPMQNPPENIAEGSTISNLQVNQNADSETKPPSGLTRQQRKQLNLKLKLDKKRTAKQEEAAKVATAKQEEAAKVADTTGTETGKTGKGGGRKGKGKSVGDDVLRLDLTTMEAATPETKNPCMLITVLNTIDPEWWMRQVLAELEKSPRLKSYSSALVAVDAKKAGAMVDFATPGGKSTKIRIRDPGFRKVLNIARPKGT